MGCRTGFYLTVFEDLEESFIAEKMLSVLEKVAVWNKPIPGTDPKECGNYKEHDLEAAKTLVDSGEITQATYNRLKLDKNKMRDMIQGIVDVYNLEDPIGKILLQRNRMQTNDNCSCPRSIKKEDY